MQSTLILSRKDGSIIQATGLLAGFDSTPVSTTPPPASEDVPVPSSAAEQATSPTIADEPLLHISQTPTHATSYKPSHAEALAAHIYAFVSSASALTLSLSYPPMNPSVEADNGPNSGARSNTHSYGGTKTWEGDRDNEGHEREDEDEVKLLRLRTKLHEVFIIPDRRFLLCVVHDTSGAGPSASAAGGGDGSRVMKERPLNAT